MSEWDKGRHVPVNELEGRDDFVMENAAALLKQRDERIAHQKAELSKTNHSRRIVEKEITRLRGELGKAVVVVRAAEENTSLALATRLADLLVSEDILDDDLREASETLLPDIHDFFLRLNASLSAYRGRAFN